VNGNKKKSVLGFLLVCLLLTAPVKSQETGSQSKSNIKITLLQVNDVYQELPVDKGTRGGLARVATAKNQVVARQPNTLFLLAGDTLSPSIASRVFQGKQMIACWNALGINVAVFGNHEFDFGPDVLRKRMQESKFTWICANVVDKKTGKSFADVPAFVIKDIGGVKVGIFGLLTQDTLRSSNVGPDIDITDPVAAAKKVVAQMKEAGAQVIVGLTHLTMANDKQVAASAPIDVIIGGHEHYVMQSVAAGALIVKSGSDARNLGRVDINFSPAANQVTSLDWDLIPITDKIADDAGVDTIVAGFEKQLSARLDDQVGETHVELDATQANNQSKETNLGDLIADAYRAQMGTDVVVFNGGSIRSNTVYGPGKLTRRDILSMLPFENPIVKMSVSGKTLLSALENGVSQIGIKAGGRFPQVSGLTFSFDARKAPGNRVASVMVNGAPLDLQATYTLATNNFVAGGGDDYTMLKGQKLLITPEEGESESVVLLNAVTRAKVVSPAVTGRITRLDPQP
jgi:5'-nucleotidase